MWLARDDMTVTTQHPAPLPAHKAEFNFGSINLGPSAKWVDSRRAKSIHPVILPHLQFVFDRKDLRMTFELFLYVVP